MTPFARPSSRHPWVLVAVVALVAVAAAGCGGGGGATRPPSPGAGDDTGRGIEVEEEWRWAAEPPGSVGMPAADGDGVAVAYGHLRLVLLDLEGRRRWEVERLGLRDVAPALTPDLVVAATEEGAVAVDRRTGQVRWDTRVGERANGPAIVGGRAVVSTWEGSLTAFDLADGRVAWRTALPGPAIGPAATDGAAVAVTWESVLGDAAGVVAVDGADGGLRWSVGLEPGGVGGPAIVPVPPAGDDGTPDRGSGAVVVLVAGDIAAHGLALADGAERWRVRTDGRGSPEVPPLVVGGGEVLVAHRRAGLLLVDAANGEVRWGGTADGVAVRGGPAGTGSDGPFAFPIDDGRLLLAGPGSTATFLDWPGRVSGVAVAPGALLLVATREARANHLIALRIVASGASEPADEGT
ncbi:MAG TPA: PQQ-binding-like beta-propeller repeat protein [Acidimicrobiales bacterium]|nr:PQQ-binding-like beta-propeller repeat protein [Acidimicrobiales bacterium]